MTNKQGISFISILVFGTLFFLSIIVGIDTGIKNANFKYGNPCVELQSNFQKYVLSYRASIVLGCFLGSKPSE